MYLRYIIFAFISLTASLIAFCFADVIALFVKHDGQLPWLFKWASTADNPAIGDKDFNKNQMPHCDPETWWGRYLLCRAWIRRNPAYWCDNFFGVTYKEGFEYTEEGQTDANIGRTELGVVYGIEGSYQRYMTNGDGRNYFEYCKVWRMNGLWHRVQFGWHLHNPMVGQTRHLKFTFNVW